MNGPFEMHLINRNSMAKPKKKKKDQPNNRSVAENRKALHKFEILEKIECGIVLHGSEVKSLRDGKLSLDESYAHVRDGELWLVGADIGLYAQASYFNHAPRRVRKLLVHRQQYLKLEAKSNEKGLSLVPLNVYFNDRGIAKVMLGVGRGKQMHDKRETLKKRDVQRDIQREMNKKNR